MPVQQNGRVGIDTSCPRGTEIKSTTATQIQNRAEIIPGFAVVIILKKDQRSGKLTAGIVKDLLTKAAFHSRGIKVMLEDGQVGRVLGLAEESGQG